MSFRCAIALLCTALFAVPAVADEIYRWVDDQGVLHFSDVPQDGAETVELPPPATYTPPPSRQSAAARRGRQSAERTPDGYEGLTIVSPAAEETIWNTAGVINVAVSPAPGLQDGHSVNIFLNGRLIDSKAPTGLSAEVTDVPRGEHTVTAEIRDAAGRRVISAQPVTFYYRQTLIPNATTPRIRPSPAVRPRPRARTAPAPVTIPRS